MSVKIKFCHSLMYSNCYIATQFSQFSNTSNFHKMLYSQHLITFLVFGVSTSLKCLLCLLYTSNMGCSYLRPFRSDRCAFGIYLCFIPSGKKRSGRSPLKEADRNDTSAKEGKTTSEHRLTDKSDFFQLCQRAAYRGCHLSLIHILYAA